MSAARFLRPREIATELGVSLATVYRVIGEMHPIGVGRGAALVRVESLADGHFLARVVRGSQVPEGHLLKFSRHELYAKQDTDKKQGELR